MVTRLWLNGVQYAMPKGRVGSGVVVTCSSPKYHRTSSFSMSIRTIK